MNERATTMVIASFAGDSLALGAHWIYDTQAIHRALGRVDSLMKPQPNSYHPTKQEGESTHYGDQTFVLLESLAARKGFDLTDFSSRWKKLFENYTGYVDEATRGTLAANASGKKIEDGGSPSGDLAGASRLAPLVYTYCNDLPGLEKSAIAQTRMTHNNPLTIDSAAFFAAVAFSVLGGAWPVDAMEKTARENFKDSPIFDWVKEGIASADKESVPVIAGFGQTCHTSDAFPGVVHLIAKYQNDLHEALIQAVMAGGDSAARAMMVGMILGAYSGSGDLPEEWLSEMRKEKEIVELLGEIKP
jgi:ADP-ribosylglycohydrolase